ncbi:hypothetical protein Amet_1989 [Alkaliphilus metalliredigens QYMF]|uniref:Lipoprotein n=1 Tax=Alkaliphilus metalliredigens (strain QYMF) TaxID=293826 RepID=A6TPN4_ALKMQ|nr:hypothetical protein [Alkaliphilus metalliredigens]ABR48152.1 hypothetical protein Amet_1989 [Alkaliphilus metalliredigens QYMF]
MLMTSFLRTTLILLVCLSLTACGADGPIHFYEPVEHLMKLDAKLNEFPLPQEAQDMERVKNQKNKNIKSSYKLDGLDEFKSLDIVKDVKIDKNKLDVEFLVESINKEDDKEQPLTEYIWENTLFLIYTIVDTFPEIEEMRLHAGYYYLDKVGQPYKQVIFIANTTRKSTEKINRDYFREEMLEELLDYYIAKDAIKLYEEN